MSYNINNLNKIASFMLVSFALTTPVLAKSFNGVNNNYIADASFNIPTNVQYHEVIAKYAAPQFPIGEINPPYQAISMYAAPEMPIREIIKPTPEMPIISMYAAPQIPVYPIEPQPIPLNPVIVRYAAPDMPVKEINHDVVNPIENDINNSIQKIDKNPSPANVDMNNFINNAKINSVKSNGQIENFNNNTTLNTNIMNASKAAKILYSDDGSIRILAPISYSNTKL